MARTHAKGTEIFIDEFDFSGVINAVTIDIDNPVAEVTAFSDTDATFVEGKPGFSITLNGLYSAASPDYAAEMFADLTDSDRLITTSLGVSATSGVVAYFGLGDITSKPLVSNIGDAVGLNVTWNGTKPLTRGVIMYRDTESATGADGTAYELGAIASTEQLISFLHVLSATTGTLDMKIESATSAAFTASTERLTFTQVTTDETSERKTVSGEITDTWYRAQSTIVTSADYDVLAVLGIAPL